MASPTESEIKKEMGSIGGGNDFFAAQARLQHKLDEAAREVEKLTPAIINSADEPWQIEPTTDQILVEAKSFGLTTETARENLRKKLATDAKRLATFSASAAAEISEALAEAEAARERAENVLAEHESALAAVSTGIFAIGQYRRKIAVARSLAVDRAGQCQLAKVALDYFVDKHTISETVQNSTGFRTFAEDLVLRSALTEHIEEYVAPMEEIVAMRIKLVRAQAAAAGIDLKRALACLTDERLTRPGETLLPGGDYSGLI